MKIPSVFFGAPEALAFIKSHKDAQMRTILTGWFYNLILFHQAKSASSTNHVNMPRLIAMMERWLHDRVLIGALLKKPMDVNSGINVVIRQSSLVGLDDANQWIQSITDPYQCILLNSWYFHMWLYSQSHAHQGDPAVNAFYGLQAFAYWSNDQEGFIALLEGDFHDRSLF